MVNLDRENFFQSKSKVVVLIIIIGVAITAISLLAVSFESIDYTEYGLRQNVYTKEIDEKVYEEGFYATGPFETFIRFPSTWQTIEFSPAEDAKDIPITGRTEDGQSLVIDVSFQYRIIKDKLLELYANYGADYEIQLVKISRGAIRDVAGEYDALEFFYNRTVIATAMIDSLIAKEDVIPIEIGEFQLRNIDLPDSLEAAIEQVEVAKQDIKIAEYQQQATVIRANTLILEASAQANISIIEAQAAAEALNITLTAEGIALFNLANATGLNSTELLTYLWIKAIEAHDSAYLIIGDDTPVLFEV